MKAIGLDIARLFHLNSSNQRRVGPDLDVDYDVRPQRFRTYASAARVALSGRDFELSMTLGQVLQERRSIRTFAHASLPLILVGRILHSCYGITGYGEIEGVQTAERPCPSGGGLYPLELYVVSQRVDGLADGIYHYDPRAHQLEERRRGQFHKQLASMTLGQDMVADANLVIVVTAIFERTMWKYGQRGYRYVWLEAGHLGQNIYLAAHTMHLGAVAIGGFFEQEVDACIGVSGTDETAVYMLCLGEPTTIRSASI